MYRPKGRKCCQYTRIAVSVIIGLYILIATEIGTNFLQWILNNSPKAVTVLYCTSYFIIGYILFKYENLILFKYWFRQQIYQLRLFWRRRGKFLWNIRFKRIFNKLWIHMTNYAGCVVIICIGVCYSLEVSIWWFNNINRITYISRVCYILCFLFQIFFYAESRRRQQAGGSIRFFNMHSLFAFSGACLLVYCTTWNLMIILLMVESYLALIHYYHVMVKSKQRENIQTQ